MELTVNLGENSYPIYIENGILPMIMYFHYMEKQY